MASRHWLTLLSFRNRGDVEVHGYFTPTPPPHLQVGMISSSTSLDHSDHSSWQAVRGWMAWASRISSAENSEQPRYLIVPSPTSFDSSVYWGGGG